MEYADEAHIKKLVQKYSEFISWPIYLQTTKTETVDTDDDDEADVDVTNSALTDGDDLDVTDDADATSTEPKAKKTETRTSTDFVQVNEQPAIWTRKPSDITDEEYSEFYKTLAKSEGAYGPAPEPLTRVHFTAEGDINFHSLLYIPGKAPENLYQTLYDEKHSGNVKLYVRKVLISDSSANELLPKYLLFVKGVVDSDDLPLNVNREQLSSQQSKVLKVIGRKIVRKLLDTLTKLANESREKQKELRTAAADGEVKSTFEIDDDVYIKFWNQYGPSMKLGVLDDSSNKKKLQKLLRFKSAKYGKDRWITLDDYIEEFTAIHDSNPDNPVKPVKQILYLTCSSHESCAESPLKERPLSLNYDVLYLTEPLDEYLAQSMTTYEGFKLQSVAKEGLKLDGDSKQSQTRSKELKKKFEPLTTWLTTLYSKHGASTGTSGVSKVEISQRITDSPCVLVSSTYGWSPNMERIMKAQTFATGGDQSSDQSYMRGKKILEINPFHPVMTALNDAIVEQGGAETVGYETDGSNQLVDVANLLYDSAAVASGYTLEKSNSFATRVERLVRQQLKVDKDAKAVEPDLTVEEKALDDQIKGEESKPAKVGQQGSPASGIHATLAGTGPDGPGADMGDVDMEALMAQFQESQEQGDHEEL